jgi:hypothetical protein
MKTYGNLAIWLVERRRFDVLRQIIVKSLEYLPAGPQRIWLMIFMDQVSAHLFAGMPLDDTQPFGCVGNLSAFYDVWVFLDCPGLHNETVMTTLREASLWDEFDAHTSAPRS